MPNLPNTDQIEVMSRSLWDVPEDVKARLINLSENATYLLEAPSGFRAVLRVHRPGYNAARAIECELAWLDALAKEGVIETPSVVPGRNGNSVQSLGQPSFSNHRFMVLFEFIEGEAPDEEGDLVPGFEVLGELAARCHRHVESWDKPANFVRLSWDLDSVFGENAPWGDWRAAPGVTETVRPLLEKVERLIRRRLAAYGKGPSRYDLIHADMRFANLLVQDGETRVIDFDDCGWGWFIYDFAAAISFVEDNPKVPQWRDAWLRGYQRVRPLDVADLAEIDSVVMLRRMALLAWIGSHMEAPEPQALAPHFAEGTARLGAAYLEKMAALA